MEMKQDNINDEQPSDLSDTETMITFWTDDSQGIVRGGYFIRNGLSKFIKEMIDSGLKPVGISISLDSMNLEVFVKENEITPINK